MSQTGSERMKEGRQEEQDKNRERSKGGANAAWGSVTGAVGPICLVLR